ncbi:MAG: hypothetical protein UX97_C0015G0008 [Candidatus Beckwithbacteria bacterium GW2011_GWA2_47_25]|nr:MAG: hypothetical protein UX97_C0015G0008 [Candidatus Beckwithbacteria bacterium GW2011_GWA2_47_25]
MTGKLADINQGSTGHELLGDESVTKIVDFGILDSGQLEEAVDAASDITNEEGITSFGNKDVFGPTFGTFVQIDFECGFGGGI